MVTTSPPRTNTFAIIGFIASFIVPVVGIVFGAIARRQISASHEAGRGLARAAVIIGAVGVTAQLAFVVVWLSLFSQALSTSGWIG